MDPRLAEMIYQGALALQQGDKDRARTLLLQVVEADENLPDAWLWLSGAMDDPEDQRTALENVLALSPGNPHALHGLQVLDGRA